MARSSITIYRDYAVIDGYVQVPHNTETDKNRVTISEALLAVSDSSRVYLTGASGDNRGWKAGRQQIFRLPGLTPGESYATNPVDALANS